MCDSLDSLSMPPASSRDQVCALLGAFLIRVVHGILEASMKENNIPPKFETLEM